MLCKFSFETEIVTKSFVLSATKTRLIEFTGKNNYNEGKKKKKK